jgi:hypothetical protein
MEANRVLHAHARWSDWESAQAFLGRGTWLVGPDYWSGSLCSSSQAAVPISVRRRSAL